MFLGVNERVACREFSTGAFPPDPLQLWSLGRLKRREPRLAQNPAASFGIVLGGGNA